MQQCTKQEWKKNIFQIHFKVFLKKLAICIKYFFITVIRIYFIMKNAAGKATNEVKSFYTHLFS